MGQRISVGFNEGNLEASTGEYIPVSLYQEALEADLKAAYPEAVIDVTCNYGCSGCEQYTSYDGFDDDPTEDVNEIKRTSWERISSVDENWHTREDA